MIISTLHFQIIHEYTLYKYTLIFLISFISNTFSAISGGGAGLIQLPALILSGLPYYQALATHKVATVALGLGSSLRNFKSLRKDYFVIWQILIFGCFRIIYCGISLGAISLLYIRYFLNLSFYIFTSKEKFRIEFIR